MQNPFNHLDNRRARAYYAGNSARGVILDISFSRLSFVLSFALSFSLGDRWMETEILFQGAQPAK